MIDFCLFSSQWLTPDDLSSLCDETQFADIDLYDGSFRHDA